MTLLWVMIAGGLGSGARYLVGQWAAAAVRLVVPVRNADRQPRRLLRAGSWSRSLPRPRRGAPSCVRQSPIGFLGGFTTYSSFNQETLALFAAGATGAAVLNVAITLAGGLAAGWLGLVAARQLVA